VSLLLAALAAFVAAGLTFFSGFGLGTLLFPVLALFMPGDVAVGATAVVHFVNSVFKALLVGRHADRDVVLRFGIPAVLTALLGAYVLNLTSAAPARFEYTVSGETLSTSPAKLLLGSLMAAFGLLELWPAFQRVTLDRKYLTLGGALSGFFGGLSGHQGALRSMFFWKLGLTKEAYIATGLWVAILVDVSRLAVYAAGPGRGASILGRGLDGWLVAAAIGGALAGSLAGARLLRKVTLGFVRLLVAVLLLVLGAIYASGLTGP
jgi:uncharacterized membrane protein YfcA